MCFSWHTPNIRGAKRRAIKQTALILSPNYLSGCGRALRLGYGITHRRADVGWHHLRIDQSYNHFDEPARRRMRHSLILCLQVGIVGCPFPRDLFIKLAQATYEQVKRQSRFWPRLTVEKAGRTG